MSLDKIGTWKGGRYTETDRYAYVLVAPNKYKAEHRVIMEAHLGRSLLPSEVVHHKNENKQDNRIENLEVMTRAEHGRHHKIQHSQGLIKV